jgi:hypothetical protein
VNYSGNVQSSTLNPGTRASSRVFAVTSSAPRLRGDEQVIGADRHSRLLQAGANVASLLGVGRLERQYRNDPVEEIGNPLRIPIGARTLGDAIAQLKQHDGGDRQGKPRSMVAASRVRSGKPCRLSTAMTAFVSRQIIRAICVAAALAVVAAPRA